MTSSISASEDIVSVEREGEVAIVTLDNPPVNALSLRLRAPLGAALLALRDDPAVAAVVLICAGRSFIAGADISEFGTPKAQQGPLLIELCEMLETMPKPVIAAVHGTALGGGLEVALACHYRIADRDARLGLPEVKLGLVPGAGGTVRLPYLIGPEKAVTMILSGTPMTATEGFACGLVDAVSTVNLRSDAVEFARSRIGQPLVSIRQRRLETTQEDLARFDASTAAALRKSRGLEAPASAARLVRNAMTATFEEALQEERRTFLDLLAGDQSRAQRHLFFTTREAAKMPTTDGDVTPRPIRKVGVIGGGTMGGGIALAMANGGLPVILLEVSEVALQRGLAGIEANLAASVKRGSIGADDKTARMSLIEGSTDYASLADCDLIIEAVFEDMAVKKEVFARIDEVARAGAILATNTSYLNVDEIAAATRRPQDVLGLHFFSPAHVMKLLEIVRGEQSAPDVIASALALARRIGKTAVVVGVCHGFVGNRMLAARGAENEDLMLEGAHPAQIDAAFRAFGFPMGPFQMGDLAGLDIAWRNRKALGRVAPVADRLCAMGYFGQKSGRGFYRYEAGSREASEDPEVIGIIAEVAAERGISRRDITDEEIIERTLYPMVNEGTRIIGEKIVSRPSDIDVVWTNGYGFPVARGGPMFWAGIAGLDKIVQRLDHWHAVTGKAIYAPSALLREAASAGRALV